MLRPSAHWLHVVSIAASPFNNLDAVVVSTLQVDMAHCEQLTHPHIYGPHLNDVSLAGCARLTDASVEESCSASPSLLRLNICGCVSLRRPQIASSSLEVLNCQHLPVEIAASVSLQTCPALKRVKSS